MKKYYRLTDDAMPMTLGMIGALFRAVDEASRATKDDPDVQAILQMSIPAIDKYVEILCNDKGYIITTGERFLLALLISNPLWFILSNIAPQVIGGCPG